MIRKIAGIAAVILLLTVLCTGCAGGQNAETSAAAVADTSAEAAETGEADLSQFAGDYYFYSTYLSDQYVIIEDLEGTCTRLNEDGTGYLEWGEGNSGPISEWSVANNNIKIKAGESTINGVIGYGILLLYIGDPGSELLEYYVTEDADTTDMPRITAEEWAEMIAKTWESGTE